jgi:riboflavin biosynthesis pyrimidine reductase
MKLPTFSDTRTETHSFALSAPGKEFRPRRWRERSIENSVAAADARRRASSVDLTQAVNLLGAHFAIHMLLLEGGGHINGGFLEAGLVDEVSLLLLAGIDGRHDIPAVFDGVTDSKHHAVPLKLKSVEQRESDALWIRYEVLHA